MIRKGSRNCVFHSLSSGDIVIKYNISLNQSILRLSHENQTLKNHVITGYIHKSNLSACRYKYPISNKNTKSVKQLKRHCFKHNSQNPMQIYIKTIGRKISSLKLFQFFVIDCRCIIDQISFFDFPSFYFYKVFFRYNNINFSIFI